jgi:hypothetical protein
MVASLTATELLLLLASVILEWKTKNSEVGAAMADLFFIPSLIVPAIVGITQARRQRRAAARLNAS